MRPFPFPLALALAVALALPARAEETPPAAVAPDGGALPFPPPPVEAPPAKAKDPFAKVGLSVDAGFPEGLAVAGVYRPIPEVRLSAGPAWNVVAFGLHAGVTVLPWHLGVSPLLSLEGGRYFSADAGFVARDASGVPEELEPLLKDVSYDYVAGHVGLEFGTRDAFAISIRAGLARVWIDAKGSATVRDEGGSGGTATFVDPKVRGTLPSVKLGVQLWF